MCKSQIIARIMEVVTKETEVPEEYIRSGSKKVEVVDAKCIAIKLLSEQGLYPDQIAKYMNMTSSSVRHLLGEYSTRCCQNKILAIYAQNIRKILAA